MYKSKRVENFNLNIKPKDIDPGALFIMNKLNDSGYVAFVVGGCIRNLIMREYVQDWDITTNATVEEIIEVFRDYKVVPVGKRFGTLTIVINHINYEVSTFKKGKSLAEPPTLFEDLKHRDFTINALAWREEEGLIDYFNGVEDIKRKIIRGVEEPTKRIKEDPLRMLRAIRLACELDFEIDRITLQAIEDNSSLIKKVSLERIRDELIKILISNSPKKGFRLLQQSSLLKYILPELESAVGFYVESNHKEEDLFSYILDMLDNLPSYLFLRLSILLYGVEKLTASYSKKEIANKILYRLRFKNSLIKRVNVLIREEDWQKADFSSRRNIRRLISQLGKENILSIMEFKKAHFKVRKDADKLSQMEKIEEEIREVLQERPPLSLKDLAINGKDLINLGYQEGKVIGEILNTLLNKAIDRPELNKKELLIKLIKTKKANL